MLPQSKEIVFYHYPRPLFELFTAEQTARFSCLKDHTSAALSGVHKFVLQLHFKEPYDTGKIISDTQKPLDCLSQ